MWQWILNPFVSLLQENKMNSRFLIQQQWWTINWFLLAEKWGTDKKKFDIYQATDAKNNRYFLTFKMMIKIDFVNLYTIRNCILKKNFKNRWILIRFGDDVCQFFSFFFLTKSCLVLSAMKQLIMNPMTEDCQKDVSM